ncbi:chromobox protein homolog 5-like [Bombus vosnesenskii]|uniref:Chromobox protein homolog 5-like n=3 Tax=Pyrobombus TaxID=144703 RepID=A0A6J3KJ13_9HYME|nr:chromobox protein homolog 5 [Bombus impatiens]XP_033352940.1 chromobox protein homolog 5-like [Bombus vosnesenskii]XP_050483738.1 chromobox protein homolog 5-like isoform X1 [Bombus huntii]
MRRLSMKTKRSKSETSDSSIEENGVRRLSISDNNDEMKKGKENKNTESPRRSTAKKRSSRSRHSQKETTEDSAVKPEVEDTQAVDTEEENKNVGKAGPSKRLKKEGSSLTKQEGNNEKEYEVEKIVGQRTIKGRRQFLVRWKGYDADSDTWEQEKDLNCLELIEEFLAENAENEEDPKSKQLDNSTKSPKVKAVKVDKKSKKLKNNVKKQTENGKQIVTSDEEKSGKDDQKEFEVEKIIEVHFKKNKTREFLIRWKGFTSADDTWEPEENLNCPELITKFMQKVEKAKTTEARELRANRPHTKRYTLTTHEPGRRLSRRNMDKQRATYHECDE